MSVLTRTPQNTNFLQPTKFLLTFSRIQDTQYFCQQINLPGISLGDVIRQTPFLDLYSPDTKLNFTPLTISFTLDEELASWKNLYDWMISIANPESFDKNLKSVNSNKNVDLIEKDLHDEEKVGEFLLSFVSKCNEKGIDAEGSLRKAINNYRKELEN